MMKNVILICFLILGGINITSSGIQAITSGKSLVLVPQEAFSLVIIKDISIRNHPSALVSCSGTILSKSLVLTAAHCVVYKNIFYLYFGAKTCCDNSTEKIATDKDILVHPHYNKTEYLLEFDVGIIILRTPLSFGMEFGIFPIELPHANLDNSYKRLHAFIAGCGIIDDLNRDTPKNIQIANVTMITNRECSRINRQGLYVNSSSTICTNSTGGSVCPGDSGGPLFMRTTKGKLIQYGIISFTVGNANSDICENGLAAGYVRITAVLKDFIIPNMQYFEANTDNPQKESILFSRTLSLSIATLVLLIIIVPTITWNRCKNSKKIITVKT